MRLLKSLPKWAAACVLAATVNGSFSAFAQSPVNQLSEAEKRSGWELLFDGQSADAWRNYQKESLSPGWKVIDGALVRAEKGAGDIVTKDSYDAFELLLDYKISPAGNSGLMFHVTEENQRPWQSGPEIQIQDNLEGHDPQKTGWLYQLYRPTATASEQDKTPLDSSRPAGQWNQIYLRIAPQGCEVCLNGVRYYTFKLGDNDWKQKVEASKFANFEAFGTAGKGHICLQDHGDKVAFRNIKVRRIADDGSVPQPIDGKLELTRELAFPQLEWDQRNAVDEDGNLQRLRIIELTYPRDDSNRLFVASQHGEIWTFENKPDVTKSHLVIDLRSKVAAWDNSGANEQGLLGLAMHPDFKSNQKFYVYYSDADHDRSVVSEFTMSKDDPNKADPQSERVLMEIPQPYKNHNGGSMEFGPDGYLYIGLGDGGFRNDPLSAGQDLSTLLGSILRIDVNHSEGDKQYGIPSDNPFLSRSEARPEIYAFGFRNPWRIAFDRQTGDLWMGDVGQELWEEINVVRKGGNYGWSSREGTNSFGNRPVVDGVSDPIDPVWQYDHRIGRSVTGGRVYRNDRLPQLNGKYLYADYVTGVVWALSFDPATKQVIRNEQVIPEGVQVLAFGEDQNGEIYYCTESTRGDCIYRFAP